MKKINKKKQKIRRCEESEVDQQKKINKKILSTEKGK